MNIHFFHVLKNSNLSKTESLFVAAQFCKTKTNHCQENNIVSLKLSTPIPKILDATYFELVPIDEKMYLNG